LDTLIGAYPEAKEVYRERSPIHFIDRLSCALIVFQGLEDKVVPPDQSERMADAVQKKGLPVAYLAFQGEQHGFRRAETIIRCLEAELYFYGAVFTFTPAGPLTPIQIDNLSKDSRLPGSVRLQPDQQRMKNITFALLIAVCALAAPRAQAPPGSRVTGTITVALDVRETPRKLLHVRETLNVTPGALTLVYPKWLPGEHAPDGPIDDLVGLNFTAGGRSIPWRRDPVDVFAFHVDIPQGINRLDVSFDFLAAIGQGGFSSASSDTAHLGIYSWNQVLL